MCEQLEGKIVSFIKEKRKKKQIKDIKKRENLRTLPFIGWQNPNSTS